MPTIKITELDVIFMVYDEPNAELHWSNLLDKVPWAQRIDNINGLDTVHKEAAKLSQTEYFITVDADNIVSEKFFDLTLEIPESQYPLAFYWKGRNMINGIVSGNGGVKVWHKDFVNHMKTHENSSHIRTSLDFNAIQGYTPQDQCMSQVWSNGSPYQAWRSSFREAVKLTSNQGYRLNYRDFSKNVNNVVRQRLQAMMSIGKDVDNGIWSILGARQGCHISLFTEWDIQQINSYYWFKTMWENQIEPKFVSDDVLIDYCNELSENIQRNLGMECPILDEKSSAWYKQMMSYN